MLFLTRKQIIKKSNKLKKQLDNFSIEDLIFYEKAVESYMENSPLFNNSIFTAIFSFVLGLISSDLTNFYKLDLTEEIIAIVGGIAIAVLVILIFLFKFQNEKYIFLKKIIQLCIEEKEEQKK